MEIKCCVGECAFHNEGNALQTCISHNTFFDSISQFWVNPLAKTWSLNMYVCWSLSARGTLTETCMYYLVANFIKGTRYQLYVPFCLPVPGQEGDETVSGYKALRQCSLMLQHSTGDILMLWFSEKTYSEGPYCWPYSSLLIKWHRHRRLCSSVNALHVCQRDFQVSTEYAKQSTKNTRSCGAPFSPLYPTRQISRYFGVFRNMRHASIAHWGVYVSFILFNSWSKDNHVHAHNITVSVSFIHLLILLRQG